MSKDYGQFCGLAKASSVLGERWSLLIVRDLSLAPRRFKDLHEGLPGIPTSVLTTRLRDFQAAGVVTRVADEQPGGGVLYTLTPHGESLKPILDALGRWGAEAMAVPGPQDVVTDASLAAALRAGYQPGVTDTTTSYTICTGAATAWAEATPDGVTVGLGTPDLPADLTIHSGPELRAVLAGDLSPAAALADGTVHIEGKPEVFERFARTFRVPLAAAAEGGSR
ncbi:HxlR family transcriptional regulator [Stackebrandtia endophytica]|uniref:HxlR family transcriptional regulator n=1 Tax=Stackebrandtia endophytica TaxID=1496996 RepID=A0A543AW75_9ACTN|nr:helix-turn-helix domain-containing protein [Stackebrandtia endophytica]TQL76804.1 HxlR family transcriptional regulator [Stackebrandtia endophytica]